ncbi:MAG: iron-containing alcohol dehydrogenase [Succinivibrio sp.]
MENFDFCVPTRYIFGHGSFADTAEIVSSYNRFKKVMIVCGNHAIKDGLVAAVQDRLKARGIDSILYTGITPNPTDVQVYAGIDKAKENKVDLILAIGGGSVIDASKAIALGVADPQKGDFFDFFIKKRKPTVSMSVGVILTIPAAGSESSPNCVISGTVDGKIYKAGCATQLNRPLFAIMDPELTYSVNNYDTACGVTDILSHLMERYFTPSNGVTVSDELLEGLMRSVIISARRVLENPTDYEARANLMWASSLAHNNIAGCDRIQDWASHHLEHQLSALYDVAHGAGLAVIIPVWMKYVYQQNVTRFARFAVKVFGIDMDFKDPEVTALAGIDAFKDFLNELKMPEFLEDLGGCKADIPKLLDTLGVDDVEHTEGHFKKLFRSDCEKIYEMALRPNRA